MLTDQFRIEAELPILHCYLNIPVTLNLYSLFIFADSGKLITFGEVEGGKLGLPEDVDDTTVPQEVTGIKGKVTWVSCGGSHTVAVTGRLFRLLCSQGVFSEKITIGSRFFWSLTHARLTQKTSNVLIPFL